jgi:electron transfer flavoprotein alpha/beta subunit
MSLRVFVQVWCEIDPTLNVRVDRQTGRPLADEGDVLLRVSPLGRLGVYAALGLGGARVTAFALGDEHAEALRHALAAGAGRAVALSAEGVDPGAVSVASLAEWLRRERADLVIMDRLAGLVAGRLGGAHLAGLDELQVAGDRLRAVRHLGRGDREAVTARLPAFVRLQADAGQPPYITRSRLQAVAETRIEHEPLPAIGEVSRPAEGGPLQAARPRVRLGKPALATAASASDRLQALLGLGKGAALSGTKPGESKAKTAEQLAEEFVRYLAHHQLLPDIQPESDGADGPPWKTPGGKVP